MSSFLRLMQNPQEADDESAAAPSNFFAAVDMDADYDYYAFDNGFDDDDDDTTEDEEMPDLPDPPQTIRDFCQLFSMMELEVPSKIDTRALDVTEMDELKDWCRTMYMSLRKFVHVTQLVPVVVDNEYPQASREVSPS
jgi:hypothetical protein